MHSITSSSVTIYPLAVSQYSVRREARTVIHDVLGRTDPDVTFRPAGLRTGTLRLSFASPTAAAAAEETHASGDVFALESPVSGIAMSYVVAGGALDRSYNDAGEWVLLVPFQEVLG